MSGGRSSREQEIELIKLSMACDKNSRRIWIKVTKIFMNAVILKKNTRSALRFQHVSCIITKLRKDKKSERFEIGIIRRIPKSGWMKVAC